MTMSEILFCGCLLTAVPCFFVGRLARRGCIIHLGIVTLVLMLIWLPDGARYAKLWLSIWLLPPMTVGYLAGFCCRIGSTAA